MSAETEVTMLRLTLRPRQRAVLLEKMPDVANLAIGALMFGQFLGDKPFSLWTALGGFVIWIEFMALTLWIAKEDH